MFPGAPAIGIAFAVYRPVDVRDAWVSARVPLDTASAFGSVHERT